MRSILNFFIGATLLFQANNALYSTLNEEDFTKAEHYATHKIIEQQDDKIILDDGSVWEATDFMNSIQNIKNFKPGMDVVGYYKDFSHYAAKFSGNYNGPAEGGSTINFQLKGTSHRVNMKPISFENVLQILTLEPQDPKNNEEYKITLSDGSVWEKCYSPVFGTNNSPVPGDSVILSYVGHPFPTPGNFNITVLTKNINGEFVSIVTKLLWIDPYNPP
jgi:hypothetical protein